MHPDPLPPALLDRPFSVSSARAVGVRLDRLRRSDLHAPFHGVRTARAAPPTGLTYRCRAYLPVMHPDAVFSHVTAARLHGLPLPRWVDHATLHVTVPPPHRAPRGIGVSGHQLSFGERTELDGLPVPTAIETWIQLGALLALSDLVAAGDALVRRHDPMAVLDDVVEQVRKTAKRPGITRRRDAAALVRSRTDSAMETYLRLAIVRAGIPEPSVNYPVHTSERTYHADLAFAERRVVVEYDGDQHRTDRRQYERDIDRLWHIESAGWIVVRLNHSHLAQGAADAIRRIRAALNAAGRNTPPRS